MPPKLDDDIKRLNIIVPAAWDAVSITGVATKTTCQTSRKPSVDWWK